MLTRRQFLQLGAAGGAALVLPLERAVQAFASGPSTPQFAAAFKRLPVLRPTSTDATTDYYNLALSPANAVILPGKNTPVWAYNGLFPGPTIKAKANRRVVVTQTNKLATNASTHLHGAHVAPSSDGHPTDVFGPGQSKVYTYPNDQLASTLWYHDHTAHATSRNVYMGLAGAYLIRDAVEAALGLPGGAYDITCIIQDRTFNADGSLSFVDSANAVLGNTVLVNGKPWPFLAVSGRKYRFRFVNGSNSREYELALSSNKSLNQIASDGGLLAQTFVTPSIRLSPGERAEVVIDFAQYPAGTKIVLENLKGTATDGTDSIMRFDVGSPVSDTSKLPTTLRSITKMTTAAVTRTFALSFDSTRRLWVINGKPFDPNRIDVKPKLDAPEIWKITNSSGMAHPFHIHLSMFQILDRTKSGVVSKPGPGESGWKDTVRIDPGETVRFITKFTGFKGRYVYHCHNLAHEDHDMMAQMEVV
ncbi:MAG: multicopper oxidase family protein [Actinomycetota bacterium]|nr:multicopper oxidase family protein [Actinomycetota bacterium]PLS75410.1 MAG: bilirubin oxidase [Actinomycetota bacterium]